MAPRLRHACLFDADCQDGTICSSNRECVKPWLMGPCKAPEDGKKDPCPDYCHCTQGRCTPKLFTLTSKCFIADFECSPDEWCDIVNQVCVTKPKLFEFCELDIGCSRPYICSKYSKQCIPPCTTTDECYSLYGKMVDYPLVCHPFHGKDAKVSGYCESTKYNMEERSFLKIFDTISQVTKSIIGEEIEEADQSEIVIDGSIGSAVHPVISISGESCLPSGFNLFLIAIAVALLCYFYYYFARLRKHTRFYGGAFRASRLGGGGRGGNEQRDNLVSKLAAVTHSNPIVDLSKDSHTSVHERSSLLPNSPTDRLGGGATSFSDGHGKL